MKTGLFPTIRNYKKENLGSDIITGLIIAAVSIPISMGYAQIAGLPAVYGLYGSILPVLVFALLSTSPQFVFGVDAAPAALVGAALLSMEIEGGSTEALLVVPAITFCTAVWLICFSLFKAGKLVNYISTPVMGGFISGICVEIILMQLPKLLGGQPGSGEAYEMLIHLIKTCKSINMPSAVLGFGTLAVLLLSKKILPKFPMAVVVMIGGAFLSFFVPLRSYGISLLPSVEAGLPKIMLPQFHLISFTEALGVSMPIAIVIMAETLLAENSYALKNSYKLDDNRELMAFGLGNLSSALIGCCPINGSVSRTAMGEQYGGKTQLSCIVAGLVMLLVLLFGTSLIKYLPVPVLTAIVVSALMGACEFHLARNLWRVSRKEFYIFCGAFAGVLVLGTIYGVLIGVLLSFASVVLRSADPPRCFLGVSPGHSGFQNISKFKNTFPIEGVVIYRFSSNLFFANASIFQSDIENAVKDDTRVIIVDCAGIGSIDITAAERLDILYKSLKKNGVKLYLTEHIASLNDQMRELGIGYLIEQGAVRRTIDIALRDSNIVPPYKLVGANYAEPSPTVIKVESTIQEFVWAYGEGAEAEIDRQIDERIASMKEGGGFEALLHGSWNEMDSFDEDEWLEHLEAHLSEICRVSGESEHHIARKVELRRQQIHEAIEHDNPELAAKFEARRHKLDNHLKSTHPDVWEKIVRLRQEFGDTYGQ